jgi:hypothetical protein
LEETIRHNERDSVDTQKNIRLTFNYPGTKRALINFANTISKIDARISLAKDVNNFVANSIKETFLFNNEFFKDPIQGIETGPVYQEEPVEPMQNPAGKSHNRYHQYEEPNDLSHPGNFIIFKCLEQSTIEISQTNHGTDEVMMASTCLMPTARSNKTVPRMRGHRDYPKAINSTSKLKIKYDQGIKLGSFKFRSL